MCKCLFNPKWNLILWNWARHIICDNDKISIFVISLWDGLKSLLAGCVPQLVPEFQIIDLSVTILEINADCRLHMLGKRLTDKLSDERRLANRCGSNQTNLDNHIDFVFIFLFNDFLKPFVDRVTHFWIQYIVACTTFSDLGSTRHTNCIPTR